MTSSPASIATVAALALALAIAALAPPMAHARGRKAFLHRVDLRTGKTTLVSEVDVGRPKPGRVGAATEMWWLPSAGGHQPEIGVRAVDDVVLEPSAPRVRTLALAVLADNQVRLRVPPPDDSGSVLWYALEGDMLVVGWASKHYQRMGIDLARGRVAWSRPAPGPEGSDARRGEHGRAVGNGRLFVYDYGAFESLDAASGATIWRRPRAPSDAASYVEICGATHARWVIASDQILALDPGSGELRWRASFGPGLPRWCLVQGERVFSAWRTGIGDKAGEKDIVAALAANDGKVVWRRGPGDMAARGIAVGGDGLVIWSPDDGIVRIDPNDGTPMWRLPDVMSTSIEVLPGGDWFLPDGGCARVDPRAGVVRWKLGAACRRRGDAGLLVAVARRQDYREATVSLLQYSFDRPRLRRQGVVHRYRGFCDVATSAVIDVVGDEAVVLSEFTVLD